MALETDNTPTVYTYTFTHTSLGFDCVNSYQNNVIYLPIPISFFDKDYIYIIIY